MACKEDEEDNGRSNTKVIEKLQELQTTLNRMFKDTKFVHVKDDGRDNVCELLIILLLILLSCFGCRVLEYYMVDYFSFLGRVAFCVRCHS